MNQTVTERRHDHGRHVVLYKRTYEDPEPQPRPLRRVALGCWFMVSVNPAGGEHAQALSVRNPNPSIRELRAIADACNEIADAQEELNA